MSSITLIALRIALVSQLALQGISDVACYLTEPEIRQIRGIADAGSEVGLALRKHIDRSVTGGGSRYGDSADDALSPLDY